MARPTKQMQVEKYEQKVRVLEEVRSGKTFEQIARDDPTIKDRAHAYQIYRLALKDIPTSEDERRTIRADIDARLENLYNRQIERGNKRYAQHSAIGKVIPDPYIEGEYLINPNPNISADGMAARILGQKMRLWGLEETPLEQGLSSELQEYLDYCQGVIDENTTLRGQLRALSARLSRYETAIDPPGEG